MGGGEGGGVELADQGVDFQHGGFGFGGVGTELVAGVVDVGVVEGDEVGAGGFGLLEPGEHLVDAGGFVYLVVEFEVVGGALIGDFGFRAGPEEAGGAHALAFREGPEAECPLYQEPSTTAAGLSMV